MNKHMKVITKIAILSALATILMLFSFPLPFFPSFYKIDLSEVPVIIGAFAMGPIPGIIIEALKNIVNCLIEGSDTAGIGELSNFIIGSSFIAPASIIYKIRHTRKGAILGLGVGILTACVVGGLINAFVLLPVFAEVYQLPMSVLIGMGTKITPLITDLPSFILVATVPFNLIKTTLYSAITLLLYKKISFLLVDSTFDETEEEASESLQE